MRLSVCMTVSFLVDPFGGHTSALGVFVSGFLDPHK